MAVASEKVLWRVPATSLYISLPNGCFFIKSSLKGSANCALHLPPSLLLGSELRELLTCLNHTNPVRRKRPIMSLLLGYSFGLFLFASCNHSALHPLRTDQMIHVQEEKTQTDRQTKHILCFQHMAMNTRSLFLGGLNGFLDADSADVLNHGDAVTGGQGARD